MIWLLILIYSKSLTSKSRKKISTKSVYLDKIALRALSAFNRAI